VTLDIIRGTAVMGILLANIPGFALPEPAYFSPLAYGGHGPAEVTAWLLNFVFVEGKMRGLFSVLFGASMLLVIERAEAAGESTAKVHFARMAVLFLLGLGHMYFVWWGDILAHYALAGAVAFLFHRLNARTLLLTALLFLALNLTWNAQSLATLVGSAERDSPQAIAIWNNYSWYFGVPPRDWLLGEITAMRGPWAQEVAWRWHYLDGAWPFFRSVGAETLGAMLLGMACYRSGFITGGWDRRRYRNVALIGLGIALPAYLLLGITTIQHGFDQRWVYLDSIVATVPLRLLGTIGYAAVLLLLIGREGWLSVRLAAVGRTAFTNYLATSILVTAIFYGWGLGQFARWDRASIYCIPPFIWLLMLLWSKPWLDRFAYGPFEWAWRSLARWKLQPMRRAATTQTP
jgi:uncharacterized protein